MYYIYHIPSMPKIGTSINPEERVKAQGYTNYEILEIHEDIYVASRREQELQKEYGYKVDNLKYYQTLENQSIEACRRGGKKAGRINGPIQGRKNVESGHLQSISSKGGKIGVIKANATMNAEILTCPHCNFTGKGRGNMKRWHFDNCKKKDH